MTASGYTMSVKDLRASVGNYLRYGTDNFTADHLAEINEYVSEGYVNFLQAHQWTFLLLEDMITVFSSIGGTAVGQPTYDAPTDSSTTTLTEAIALNEMIGNTLRFQTSENEYTIIGVGTSPANTIVTSGNASSEAAGQEVAIVAPEGNYRLPDDFGGLEGHQLSFEPNLPYGDVYITSPGNIRRNRMFLPQGGYPRLAAIQALASDNKSNQKHELMIWPLPSDRWNLLYQYRRLIDIPSGDNDVFIGDPQHMQTIKQACVAVAELRTNDMIGQHDAKYQQLLARSIVHDNRFRAAQLGPWIRRARRYPFGRQGPVQYVGSGQLP